MTLANIFDIAGSALSAQSIRLNTIASNLANADVASHDPQHVYKARHPIFKTKSFQQTFDLMQHTSNSGVTVEGVMEDQSEAISRYQPHHPLADRKGYVYYPNINAVEQTSDMINASQSFKNATNLIEITKEMAQQLFSLDS